MGTFECLPQGSCFNCFTVLALKSPEDKEEACSQC